MEPRAYGERALLCELDPADVPGWRAAAHELPGVAEVVPGARTLLVVARSPADVPALRAALAGLRPVPAAGADRRAVTIVVDYDGLDLADVARQAGLSPAAVVAAHTAPSYLVRFCGFAPGFAYLDGLDERLRLPRRAEPRTSVPAGSVGIAGEFTGVYPRPSPGGWQLLGRTAAVLWDVERDPPALLSPGTTVRFVAT